jgi:hypothetical protein
MFGFIGSIIGLLLFLIGAAIAIGAFVFWIWMLIDAIKNKGLSDTEKVVWVLVIIFLHFLGGLIYFFAGRPRGAGGMA